MDYIEKTKIMIELTSINSSDIYYFDSTPYESEFQKIFDFYCETLEIHSDYGINPSHLFFINNISRNARATKYNDQFIIGLNSGTIIYLIETFKNQFSKNKINLIQLNQVIIGTEANNLLYQLSLHFTLYHELAHLIQRSNSIHNETILLNDSVTNFSERKHLEELDADCFSSLCLATHVIQLFETNYKENKSILEFKKLIIASTATCIYYILSFSGADKEIYFHENSHPHPIIRISNIIGHFLEYIQQNYGKHIFTDILRKEVVEKAFELNSQIFDDNKIDKFKDTLSKNYIDIKKYLEFYKKLEENDKSLAVYKWNEKAKLNKN
ncbi:MAG: hypothetical protein HYR91_04285 [Flavobacteriia bacterium]|nr:hypothetical protein [Flavobacteriia bacterium]